MSKRKFHLPNREWTKIIRFNGSDYLLRSLFDDDFDFDAEVQKDMSFDFDAEYRKDYKKYLRHIRYLRRKYGKLDD